MVRGRAGNCQRPAARRVYIFLPERLYPWLLRFPPDAGVCVLAHYFFLRKFGESYFMNMTNYVMITMLIYEIYGVGNPQAYICRRWLHMEHARYALSTHPTVLYSNLRWFAVASVVFMNGVIVDERRAIAVYPVFIFYTFIAWLIMLQ